MPRFAVVLVVLSATPSCSNDRSVADETRPAADRANVAAGPVASDPRFAPLPNRELAVLQEHLALSPEHIVQVTTADEPGRALVLCGTLVDKQTRNPVGNERIHWFQADRNGRYEQQDPMDPPSARLNGVVTTDAQGRFTVQTIAPGYYGTPEHLHAVVGDAKLRTHTVFFEPFMDAEFRRQRIEGGDRNFAQMPFYASDLWGREDGTLVGFVTMEAG